MPKYVQSSRKQACRPHLSCLSLIEYSSSSPSAPALCLSVTLAPFRAFALAFPARGTGTKVGRVPPIHLPYLARAVATSSQMTYIAICLTVFQEHIWARQQKKILRFSNRDGRQPGAILGKVKVKRIHIEPSSNGVMTPLIKVCANCEHNL